MAAASTGSESAEVGRAEEMGRSEFLECFSECIAKGDYSGALAICKKRLKVKPDDGYVVEMRRSVERFMDAADALEEDASGGGGDVDWDEHAPEWEELQEKALGAVERAVDVASAYLRDANRLWELGEEAIGIFWDPGQIAPPGKLQSRFREVSVTLAESLAKRLKATERQSAKAKSANGQHGGAMESTEWLFEGLGQLWWRRELGLEVEAWLVEGCLEEWSSSSGSLEVLVGFPKERLRSATREDLCDVLPSVCALERSAVCGLFGKGRAAPRRLDYGVQEVLEEVHRRPLVEAPMKGFLDSFYLMTRVVYVLNCYNGALPNRRADCPWLFSYLERCLNFFLTQCSACGVATGPSVAPPRFAAEAVEAIAEAVDCLRGLGELDGRAAAACRAGVAFLLSRQEADGFFSSTGAKRPADSEYETLRPTWRAIAALQLDRVAPAASAHCKAWSTFARAAAERVEFASPPPIQSAAADEVGDDDEEEGEGSEEEDAD